MATSPTWARQFEDRLTEFLKEYMADRLTKEGLSRPPMAWGVKIGERHFPFFWIAC